MNIALIWNSDIHMAKKITEMVRKAALIRDECIEIASVSTEISGLRKYVGEHKIENGIYFLDIESGQDDSSKGLDLAEEILSLDQQAQIIFVTSNSKMAIYVFERRISTLDYIIKTNDLAKMQQRITESLGLALRNIETLNLMKKLTFSFKVGRTIRNVNIDDILYISTTKFPHKLQIVSTKSKEEFVGDLKDIDEHQAFLIKVSQSYLINPKNVAMIDLEKHIIYFHKNERIKYSRGFTKIVKRMINDLNLVEESLVNNIYEI